MISRRTKTCTICHSVSSYISESLGVCVKCIKKDFKTVLPHIKAIHARSRADFDLPSHPPRCEEGFPCTFCENHCVLNKKNRGFCGLRIVKNDRIDHLAGTVENGLLQWYRDPLPTNCVADWVCEGHKHPSSHNLAVFYESCSMNCLFCQNWHFRNTTPGNRTGISAVQLAAMAKPSTFCVCYFGGDPSTQMPHALAASNFFAEKGVRICWETNGMMNPEFLDRAIDYSLETGGCIKFDLKAFDENLHIALTGISNKFIKQNFKRAIKRSLERSRPPLVVASTLLVPGYIDHEQVRKIAGFIASLNPEIPYSLLAFAPRFYMKDMPFTSANEAGEAECAAFDAGLVNVRIANKQLL